MITTVHIFHKPEEAEAFMFGIDHASHPLDGWFATDLGPEPNEVTVRDYRLDPSDADADHRLDPPAVVYDHRLQISNPIITTHP